MWSPTRQVSQLLSHKHPTLPPSQRFQGSPGALPAQLGGQQETGGDRGRWGSGLFSLQCMNKQNYSEHTHPQPESSWSKAYVEFIWCAIHYLSTMKKNDFYCTELLHIIIYVSAFCLKQTTKRKEGRKKRKKEP